MNKPLTFLLSLTFLFLFSGSVYGEEPEVFEKKYEIELVDLLNSIETNVLRGGVVAVRIISPSLQLIP
jgi:hypothetical protein